MHSDPAAPCLLDVRPVSHARGGLRLLSGRLQPNYTAKVLSGDAGTYVWSRPMGDIRCPDLGAPKPPVGLAHRVLAADASTLRPGLALHPTRSNDCWIDFNVLLKVRSTST